MTLSALEAAFALYDDNKFDEALFAFKQILRDERDNLSAHFQLALIYLTKKQYQKALHHAEKVRKLDSKYPDIHLNIGCIYATRGDIDLAIKFLKKEISLYPNSPESLFNLGTIYLERHQWKAAAKYYEKSSQLNYRAEDIVDDLAFCYQKRGETDKEIALYRNWLKRDSHDWWAMMNLGACLIDSRQPKESLIWSSKAKKLNPEEPIIDRNIEKAHKLLEQERRIKKNKSTFEKGKITVE